MSRAVEGGIELHVRSADRLLPRVVTAAEEAGCDVADLAIVRAEPGDCLHQPHREGPARLMARQMSRPMPEHRRSIGANHHPLGRRRPSTWIALAALMLRDLVVLRKNFWEFVIRTLVQPFLLCFVFLYVFPKIGQSVGAGTARRPSRRSPPCWCPGWSASRSCSRESRRWPCRWPRSSASPGRSRTASRPPAPSGWWPSPRSSRDRSRGSSRPPSCSHRLGGARRWGGGTDLAALVDHRHRRALSCVAMSSLGLLLGTSFEPRNIGLMFGFVVLPVTFLGGTYYQWTRLVPVKLGTVHWLQILVLDQPAHLRERGDAGGLHRRRPHAPLRHLPGAGRLLRPLPRPGPAQLPAPRPFLSAPLAVESLLQRALRPEQLARRARRCPRP